MRSTRPTPRDRLLAWGVHVYTATGAVLAFGAILAIGRADYRTAFLLLFATVLIDSSDGWLARRFRVAERLPAFDGARLDDIVDYLTYVFVPAILLYEAALVPRTGLGVVVIGAILLSSGYGFARADAKTADQFFTGFPSYWNVVAFYLYAGGTPAFVNAWLLLALCLLIFVPIGYIYPSRTPTLRALTVTLGATWAILVLVMIWKLPEVSRLLLVASLIFPAYYGVLSLVLHRRR
jgi:phosphatidylcholine synthase